ncbi:hypothetical protein V1525DRAFT_398836 [Lipomyces kononenkoae]|uniref:Uncharacterized protein n=1 Tax=Lipomyces kononenkoae TaxID=34357 RepID=A0ACC3T5I0_LIPKO
MLSAREERKMMARIKQLEQEDEKEHGHSHSHQDGQSGEVGARSVKKRKRSSPHRVSPSAKHAEAGPNGHGKLGKVRQHSPSTNSDRSNASADRHISQSHNRDHIIRKTANGVGHADDAESEMSTDDDFDWLPPKLLLVRKFFRARERELAKMSPDSISSRDKGATSEPVSPSDTDISSRKGSVITVKEERRNSPDFVRTKHKERRDRSIGSQSPGVSPRTIPASPSGQLKAESRSPVPRRPSTESPSMNLEVASKGPCVHSATIKALAEKSKSGPNLAELFSDSVEEVRPDTAPQGRPHSPSTSPTELRQTASTEDTRTEPGSQPISTSIHLQQQVRSPLQSHANLPPPTPVGRSDATTTASSTNGVKAPGLRVQLPPQSPFLLPYSAMQQPGQFAQPAPATPGSVSTAAIHSPFALQSPSPVTPSGGAPTVQPPRPVKKLSFADYRKKQNPGGKEKEKDKTEEDKKE